MRYRPRHRAERQPPPPKTDRRLPTGPWDRISVWLSVNAVVVVSFAAAIMGGR